MTGTKEEYIEYRILKSKEIFEDVFSDFDSETVIPLISQVEEFNNELEGLIRN